MHAQALCLHVKMFYLVLLALGNEARVVVQDGIVLHVLPVYINTTLTEIVINASANASNLPGGSSYLYVNRMTQPQWIEASDGQGIVSPYSFREFSLVRLYGRELIFFGDVPREYRPHVEEARPKARVSTSLAEHNIANGSLCGWQDVGFRVWVACDEPGDDNVLSLKALGLGYHLRDGEMFILRGRAPGDDVSSVTVVFVLFLFLSIWTDWTKKLWTRLPDEIFGLICEYYTMVADLVLIIVNINIYTVVNDNHVYNFTSGRLVTADTLYWTRFVYGFVVSPLAGLCVLATLTVRSTKQAPIVPFGWGLPFVEMQPLWYRCALSTVVLGVVLGIIIAAIVYGKADYNWAYTTTVTSVAFVAHRSTPSFLSWCLRALHIEKHWQASLVATRWSAQMLLLTCALNHFPPEDGGVQFTGFCSIVVGIILLVTAGRDGAYILSLEPHIMVVASYTLISAFVVWYTSLFCIGNALFADSDALVNKSALSLECAITVSTVMLVSVLIASCPSPSPPTNSMCSVSCKSSSTPAT